MTTQPHLPSTTTAKAALGPVPPPRARVDRLEQLLARRRAAAMVAVAALSHCAPGSEALFHDVLILEEAIREEFPAAYERGVQDWLDEDSMGLHIPEIPSPTCHRCGQHVPSTA